MANPDGIYNYDDGDGGSAWIIIIFIVISLLGLIFAFTNKDQQDCHPYLDGAGEVVDSC